MLDNEAMSSYNEQIKQGVEPEVLRDLGYGFSVSMIGRLALSPEVKFMLGLDFLPQSQPEKTIALKGLNESLGSVKNISHSDAAVRRIFGNSIESFQSANLSVYSMKSVVEDLSASNIKDAEPVMLEIARFRTLENIFANLGSRDKTMPRYASFRTLADKYLKDEIPKLSNDELIESFLRTMINSENRFNFWKKELISVKNHPLAGPYHIENIIP